MTYILRQEQPLINTNALQSLVGYMKKHDSVDLPTNSLSRHRKILLIVLLSGSTVLYMLPWQCKSLITQCYFHIDCSWEF